MPTEPTHATKEELARLDAMGLREVDVHGTHLKLVGMKDASLAPPTLAQRAEMAKRLNEVGPSLPRYVRKVIDAARPAASVEEVVKTALLKTGDTVKKEAIAGTGLSVKEVEKMHAQSAVDAKAREAQAKKDAAKKAKDDAAKREADAKARKALKKKDVAPKRAAGDAKPDEKAKAKGGKAAPKAAAPKAGGGIGGLCRRLIKEGKTTEQVLAAVKKEHPGAKTSAASVAWYRSQMKNGG